jgi:DNA polymerase III alpha subunit
MRVITYHHLRDNMANTEQYPGYVDLIDRRLWCDGDVSVDPSQIANFTLKYNINKIYTTKLTSDIKTYNKFVTINNQITKKCDINIPVSEWNIPDHYKQINIKEYIFSKFYEMCDDCDDSELITRVNRIQSELKVYTALKLTELLQTLIYVIDKFTYSNTIWGVGRGSSVSSYILYIIGVHDIDSVTYELDFNDFLQIK